MFDTDGDFERAYHFWVWPSAVGRGCLDRVLVVLGIYVLTGGDHAAYWNGERHGRGC